MALDTSLDRSELCRPGETQYTDTQGWVMLLFVIVPVVVYTKDLCCVVVTRYIRVPGDTCTDQEKKLKSITKPCKGYEKEAGFGWKDVNHFLTKVCYYIIH